MGLLTDFLQGASNSAASNISAPVDGIAWLLRKAGIDTGTPVMGSDWMAQKGFTAQPQNRNAGLLGEAIGGVAPLLAAAKAPQIAKGLLSLDDKAMDMGRQAIESRMVNSGMLQPATVWHGSPHKFDKFDSSKIGTGEGAQAYGHGLYLAESPDVAKMYATGNQGRAAASDGLIDALPKPVQMDLYKAMNMRDGFVKDAMLDDIYKQYPQAKTVAQAKDAKLYKVDLPDEHIAKMLDWDRPLSKQHPDIQALASKYDYPKNRTGGDFQRWLSSPSGGLSVNLRGPKDQSGLEKQAADLFRQHGIPGIKYLDATSRMAGEGTSNFVVFPGNEGLLSILERNGAGI